MNIFDKLIKETEENKIKEMSLFNSRVNSGWVYAREKDNHDNAGVFEDLNGLFSFLRRYNDYVLSLGKKEPLIVEIRLPFKERTIKAPG